MTTVEDMAHEDINTAAVVTGIGADKSPRNSAESQTSKPLGSRAAEFKNLKLSKRLIL